jgi:hypothetical protein
MKAGRFLPAESFRELFRRQGVTMERSQKPLVHIKGIYATALTGVLLDRDFRITRPSPAIRQRFQLESLEQSPDVSIEDSEDRQSVRLKGASTAVEQVMADLRETLHFFALRDCDPSHSENGLQGKCLELDFPSPAKEELDRLRARHLHTLPRHHYLRLLDPEKIDEAEARAFQAGAPPESILQSLMDELLYQHLKPGVTLEVRHQKAGPDSFTYAGTIARFRHQRELILDRQFRAGGTYDSLGVSIEKDDYGKVEFYFGEWHFRRRYFSGSGELKGEIYNINTPPEVFPGSVHYLDLEVDVVRWPDGTVKIVDEDVLEQKRKSAQLSSALVEKALDEAREIYERLTGGS